MNCINGLLVIAAIPCLLVLVHTIIRIIRHIHKFPVPQFMANLIDNPLRRKIQSPDQTATRHGIEAGVHVLEVGPGNGTYTVAAARRVGSAGKIVSIDIEPKMIDRVQNRALAEGLDNIEARLANVYNLPFEDQSFDLVYMITVIGEIPQPERAMREFFRVLTDTGTLVFSELLQDPDYPLANSLVQLATRSGFRLRRKLGNFFYYTLIFEKDNP